MSSSAIRPRPPFPRLLRVAAIASLLLLAGCLNGQPQHFAQLSDDDIWLALPVGSWLGTQDYGEPEALAACLSPTCRNRIAVGVFRLQGDKAARTEAELRDPGRLVRALDARQNADRRENRKKLDISAQPFSIGDLGGFEIAIAGKGAPQGLLYGAAVGRREGDGGSGDLRVVFAVGDEAHVVRAAVAQLVAEGF